jgi:FixJ family two-component response regulator
MMTALTPIIYLVDDDPSFLQAMSRLLGAVGYTVRAFSSPTEFLKEVPSNNPGCVVLDLQMPDLSGFDLQEALARLHNPLPILFLTGHDNPPDAARALRHGAEAFLSKRAPMEELLAAIERALIRSAQTLAQRAQSGRCPKGR